MKISNKLLSKLLFFLKNITSGNLRDLIELMQNIIEYQMEEILIYREKMFELTGKEIPDLSDDQKCRLAVKGKPLGSVYFDRASSWSYDLIMKWYHTLIGQKYSSANRKKVGRPRISQETVEKILHIARESPTLGYKQISHVLLKDKINVSPSTIKRVMSDYGLYPQKPDKRVFDFKLFLDAHRDVTVACDFCSYEIVTKTRGLVRYFVLFFIDISTRVAWCGAIVHDPDGDYMAQVARNQVDCFDGQLKKYKYVIHDRDPLFRGRFTQILSSAGVKTKLIQPRCPQQNGYAESFIKTFKTECLNYLILRSERQLRYVVHEFLEYYNHERPHSGLGGRAPDPWPKVHGGVLKKVPRLGGLLPSYSLVKEAA